MKVRWVDQELAKPELQVVLRSGICPFSSLFVLPILLFAFYRLLDPLSQL